MNRLRVGIILVLLSWFPFAQILLHIAHNNQLLTSDSSSTTFRIIIWSIQVIIGLIGLWLAGKQAALAAKEAGWKHTPAKLWQLFWHGQTSYNTSRHSPEK